MAKIRLTNKEFHGVYTALNESCCTSIENDHTHSKSLREHDRAVERLKEALSSVRPIVSGELIKAIYRPLLDQTLIQGSDRLTLKNITFVESETEDDSGSRSR